MLIVTPVNADKDAITSIKINKTKLSVSCFMANLKGFLRNHKQFTNEISFQQSRTSAFFFFLLLDVYFNQRMSEEHICKGAPGQDQLLLWLRS